MGRKNDRKRKKNPANDIPEIQSGFKMTSVVWEGGARAIYACQFNPFHDDTIDSKYYFATASGNKIRHYEARKPEHLIASQDLLATEERSSPEPNIQMLEAFEDPTLKSEQEFFCVTWLLDKYHDQGSPRALIAAGGKSKTIKVVMPNAKTDKERKYATLVGHGGEVLDLATHPIDPIFLLSSSKDHQVILWNVKLRCPLAFFSGPPMGHLEQIDSVDFFADGRHFVTGSFDHQVKVWNCYELMDIKERIKKSIELAKRPFLDQIQIEENLAAPIRVITPVATTGDFHYDFVDNVKTWGDIIISRSGSNFMTKVGSIPKICVWKFGTPNTSIIKDPVFKDGKLVWPCEFPGNPGFVELDEACSKAGHQFNNTSDNSPEGNAISTSNPGQDSTCNINEIPIKNESEKLDLADLLGTSRSGDIPEDANEESESTNFVKKPVIITREQTAEEKRLGELIERQLLEAERNLTIVRCSESGPYQETTLIQEIKLDLDHFYLWFSRFNFDPQNEVLAFGDVFGTIYLWDFDSTSKEFFVKEPKKLRHKDCVNAIHCVTFSPDGRVLLVLTGEEPDEDANPAGVEPAIWRWDRVL